MKKFNRWFAVTLVICMLLSVSAYAVGTDRTPLCGKPGIEQPELPEKPDCELPELPELPDASKEGEQMTLELEAAVAKLKAQEEGEDPSAARPESPAGEE